MMPLKQGKILPPCARQARNLNRFFLLDLAGDPAVRYELCLTGVMVVQGRALRAESLKLYYVGIRGHESYLVFPSIRLVAESCNGKSKDGACAQTEVCLGNISV
jgi:hypothetical protein